MKSKEPDYTVDGCAYPSFLYVITYHAVDTMNLALIHQGSWRRINQDGQTNCVRIENI